MAKFMVSFDGKWQEDFDALDQAIEWADEVAATGRMVWVVERRFLRRDRLRATFPKERREIAEAAWDAVVTTYPPPGPTG
jgi:hypothetical protein